MTRRGLLLVLSAGLAPGYVLNGADKPPAAPFRSAFEAQFPKAEATAAAIELEKLAAPLGIDLVPNRDELGVTPEPTPGEGDEPRRIRPTYSIDRERPPAEALEAFQTISGSLGQFLDRELTSAQERIDAQPKALERYFDHHENDFEAIETLLLREAEVRWEIDVAAELDGPHPNLMGHIRLQRLLVARALLQARRGDTDGALGTLEAAWRLNEGLSSRPELICHLIVVAAARLQVGALRKLDTPAHAWVDRLRSQGLLRRFVTAFQNELWYVRDAMDLTGEDAAYVRSRQALAREFAERDLCSWTPETMRTAWESAWPKPLSEEGRILADIAVPNLVESFARWSRFAVDAELTALILDARAERAASPRRAWPGKLLTLGTGVCPNEKWSYRSSADGTAAFAFEGRVVMPSIGPRAALPLTFTAGIPLAAARQARPKTESGFVRGADGVRLFYRKVVDGAPVSVLLHGGPGSNMNAVWPDLQPLGKGRTIVTYDQRGGGRSQILKDPARLTAQHHVRDLEAVRKALRLERFTLIGESWGALLAALYASEHPTRVENLLLIGPAPPTRAIMEQRLDESDQTMGLRKQLTEIAGSMPGAPDPVALCREFFGLYMKQFFVRPEAIARRRGSSCNAPADGVRNYFVVNHATLASLGDYDLRPVLSRLTVPAMVIEGAASIPSTVESARVFAQSLPGATLVLVPDAGHFPQVERPDLFFPAVEKFLSEAVRDGEKGN